APPPPGRRCRYDGGGPRPAHVRRDLGQEGHEVQHRAGRDGLVAEDLELLVRHVRDSLGSSAPRIWSSSPVRSPPLDRASPATSTIVRSPSRRPRSQIRRGRMSSDASSPVSASTMPASAILLRGLSLTCSRTN